MTNDTHQREAALFDAAAQLREPQRSDYLDQSCGGYDSLRQRLLALLRAHENTDSFLERPLQTPGSETTLPLSIALAEKPGDKIGRYKLLQQIGEGGCGVVYMAEQEEPVRRRVALKIIKLGMDTKQVIARFEAERQALAMMDHPNIAKIFDAGVTETGARLSPAAAASLADGCLDELSRASAPGPAAAGDSRAPYLSAGRPYFVMELVRGVKITEFCDHNKLPTSERLALFLQVCSAIQHAHQKGIIHRDLKPSNILVTLHDGVPVPKVIDFGIAKATQARLTDKTVFTAFEQMIGTPAYMSPEQAEMSGLDIDTRSDIYSLGVLLYELLTGKTPFDAKKMLEAGLDAMRRTIREQEPERPSTKLSTMIQGELTTTAARRQTEPPKLVHAIRGDLDWIVMKCLEKDRARRYETANGLAMDLQRHQNQEPVTACPPSNLYRLRKLVRRNKLAFAAAAAVTASLLIGLGMSTWMFIQEREAKREQARLRELAQTKEKKAQTEAAKSKKVAGFLEEMLNSVNPEVALGHEPTMRELLDKAAGRIGTEFKNQPEIEAELRSTIGTTYYELSDFPKAEAMHREALRLRRALYGETNRFVAASLHDLAKVLFELDKDAEGEPMLRKALEMRRSLLGNDSPEVADSLTVLAGQLIYIPRLDEADAAQREALRIQQKVFHGACPELVASLGNRELILFRRGKLDEAEAVAHEALAMSRELWGNDNADAAGLLCRLGDLLREQGKPTEAESMYREGLAMQRKVLGNGHADLVDSLNHLTDLLRAQGRLAEVEPFARECLEIQDQKRPDRWQRYKTRCLLGAGLLAQGKYAEAETWLLSGYQGLKQREDEVLAHQPKALVEAQVRLVQLYEATARPDQASSWKKELTEWTRKQVERSRQAGDVGDSCALNGLAWLLATSAHTEVRDGHTAVALAEKAVAGTQRKDAAMLDTLAAAYAEAGDFAKAVSVQQEAIALRGTGKGHNDFVSRLKLYESNTPYREP
jgi:serine/threonine protein kinase